MGKYGNTIWHIELTDDEIQLLDELTTQALIKVRDKPDDAEHRVVASLRHKVSEFVKASYPWRAADSTPLHGCMALECRGTNG